MRPKIGEEDQQTRDNVHSYDFEVNAQDTNQDLFKVLDASSKGQLVSKDLCQIRGSVGTPEEMEKRFRALVTPDIEVTTIDHEQLQ